MQELKEEFDKFGWLLTAPLGVIPNTIEQAFDIPAISKYLDYMFALCYAYHGDWSKQAGPNAPLYPLYQDDDYNVVCIHLVYIILVLFTMGYKPYIQVDLSFPRNLQETVV